MNDGLKHALKRLGISDVPHAVGVGAAWLAGEGPPLTVRSPIDGSTLAEFPAASVEQVNSTVGVAADAFAEWRDTPAPVRGELVRLIGNAFRERQEALSTLVAWEAGKILPEARGEVQEVIDICDFAVGLSRQLYGKTIASERPGHRLTEYWHPLGPVGVISAFNFPVAVWAWNAMIGLVCGDPIVWKPSEKTPLSAIACQHIVQQTVLDAVGPPGLSSIVIGGADVGQSLASSPLLPLVSATGSVPMGRSVAKTVAARLGAA
jgi:aldehyde dehydrogenase (NAD+)